MAAPSREISGKMQHRWENALCDKCGIITHTPAGGTALKFMQSVRKIRSSSRTWNERTQIANFDSFSGFLAKSIIRRVRPHGGLIEITREHFYFQEHFIDKFIKRERGSGQKGGEKRLPHKCCRTICGKFAWKFLCRNANKIRSNEKIPFDEGSQKKEECSKNISHFRRAPKDKEGKGVEREERVGRGTRCPQWGVLSATSTGYDKVAHSLPTVTTPRHCLCPLLPPPCSVDWLLVSTYLETKLPASSALRKLWWCGQNAKHRREANMFVRVAQVLQRGQHKTEGPRFEYPVTEKGVHKLGQQGYSED